MLKDTLLDIAVTIIAGALCSFVALILASAAGIVPIFDLWQLPEFVYAYPLAAMLLALCIPLWGRIAITLTDFAAHS